MSIGGAHSPPLPRSGISGLNVHAEGGGGRRRSLDAASQGCRQRPYRRKPITWGTASAKTEPSADTSLNPAEFAGESRYVSGASKRSLGVSALKFGVVVIPTAMIPPLALM